MAIKFKLTTIFIVTILILSQFALITSGMEVVNYSQVTDGQKSVDYLALLGIIDEDEVDGFMSDGKITKGEAAYLIVKSLGIDFSLMTSFNVSFVDFDPNGKYSNAVAAAISLGILSGNPDGTLGAEEEITVSQAAKMLVTALGHGPRAEYRGGYPTGYVLIAADLKILKNTPSDALDGRIEKKTFGQMLYNSLNVSIMQPEKISDNGTTYSTKETMRESYLDANELIISEGTLEIDDKQTTFIDNVRVNTNNTKIENYIGYSVEYVAELKEGAVIPLILRFRISEDTVVRILSRENYAKYEGDRITFDDIATGKPRFLKLSTNVVFIYNNRRVTAFAPSLLDFKNGVRVIDHNDDGNADSIIWTKSQSFIVDRVNITNKTLYLLNASYRNNPSVSFEEIDDRLMVVRTLDGEEIDWRDIQPKDAISIIESEDGLYFEVILLENPILGVITSMTSDDKTGDWVEINGDTYGVSAELTDLSVNTEGKFYINEYGEIFKYEKSLYSYVYLIDKDNGSSKPLEGEYKIRIYDNYKGIQIYNLANRVTVISSSIDASMPKEIAYSYINSGVVVSLELNNNNEVRQIIEASVYGELGERQYRKYANAFNDQSGRDLTPFRFDENTVFFVVPKNNNIEDFGAVPTYKDDQRLETQAYDFDKETETVKALVVISDTDGLVNDTLGPDSDVGIVTKVGQITDKDNQVTYFVEGFSEGKEFRYNAGHYQRVFDVVGRLREGDVIQFNISFSDEIVNIKRIIQLRNQNDYIYENPGTNDERYFGPVMMLTKNAITNNLKYLFHQLHISKDMSFDTMTRMDIYAYIENKENDNYKFSDYYIYDRGLNKISLASIDDIIPYSRSTTNPSTVFIYRNISSAKGTHARILVIVK